MRIAFIGIGNVGFALANNLQKVGHEIVVANDNPESASVQSALSKNSNFSRSKVQEAIDMAEAIFLATPFQVVTDLISAYDFKGKIIVDCTNPVGPGMTHGLNSVQSGSEMIQSTLENSYVVKAFTIYGFENFIDNTFSNYNVKPAMLICGNHESSKQVVSELCKQLGWNPVDTGKIGQALHLEHMTLLWIKMARIQGKGADFVWAMLER